MSKKAFTLVELLIVITIIAILATIGVAIFLRARINSNEAAVISELKSIISAQEQFVISKVVDVDNNGVAEYGLMGEITGAVAPRGSGRRLQFISASLAPNVNIVSNIAGQGTTKSGYLYQILLPGIQTDGNGVVGNTFAQENKFRVYSWPTAVDTTGQKAFFTDVGREILFSSNDDTNYSGVNNGPSADAAVATGASFPTDDVNFLGIAVPGEITNDGQVWRVIGE